VTDAQYRFLPWVRTGLAAGIPQGQTDSTGRSPISITLSIGGAPDTIAKSGRLYGPGDTVGLDPRQVIRTDPPAGTTSFEPNYFPSIEFDAPELPWMLSPAAPKDKDWLSPWICLVVFERDKAQLVADAKPLPKLVFASGAGAELPDLDQAALWAHAQVAGGVEPVSTLVTGNPAQNLSRLLCARRLRAGMAYLACVVPTYRAGVQAGLGKPVTAKAEPAWTADAKALELPVYFSWEFSTGPDGDFEALASRLEGRKLGTRVGLRPMDVRKPGGNLPAPAATGILDLEGALQAQTLESSQWTKPDRDKWTGALLTTLRTAPGGQQVVTPPVYGAAQAGVEGLPPNAPAWLADLNVDPRTRAAAGLGARVVHDQQEQLVASAWEQADEIERANQILRQAQLAQSVADAIYRTRLQPMAAGTLLQVTAPAHARVSEGAATLEASVAGSAFPESAASAAFRRAARPGGPIGRGLEDDSRGPLVDELAAGEVVLPLRPAPDGTIAVDAVSPKVQLVDAEPSHFEELGIGWKYAKDIRDPTAGVASRMLRSADAPRLMAARMIGDLSRVRERDFESDDPRDTQGGLETDQYLKVRLANIRFRFRTAAKPMQDHLLAALPQPPPPVQEDPLDLGAVKQTLAPDPGKGAGVLDPATTVPARVLPLVPAADTKASDPLRPLVPAPRFDQPMMLPLRDLGQEFLLPGLGDVPPETVGLLQGNARFIESYLVGLNTALAQELFFRGYVTSPDATFFYRFWDGRGSVPGMSGPDAGPDIDPIASWDRSKPLGKHARGVGGSGMTLLLIRGELVRRNPQLTVYAGKAIAPDDIRPELYPDFRGFLDPDAVFLGFAIAIDKLLADPTWHFVLEEHVTAPRFGLDESRLKNGKIDWAGKPATWIDAAWTDLAASAGDLDKLAYVPRDAPFGPLEHDGAVWGRNGAHMAAITFQSPVRVAFPATTLLKR
jgi:hypothetical protein